MGPTNVSTVGLCSFSRLRARLGCSAGVRGWSLGSGVGAADCNAVNGAGPTNAGEARSPRLPVHHRTAMELSAT